VEVRGRRISLGFEHIPHPQALCPGGAGFGPIFDLSGLAPGTYQVFAAPKLICDRGLCEQVAGPATFAGALISLAPLSLHPPGGKAGVAGDREPGPARGVLPWRGRKVDFSGRVLKSP